MDALVDAGATFTVVPAPVIERIGVQAFRTTPVRFANGRVEEWPMAQVEAEVQGRRMPILCLFGAGDAPPLLGAHALEAFLLTVDPIERKLVPRDAAYLM